MTRAAARDVETVTPPLPKELQVEVTGSCNLRCQMCLVRYRPPLNRIEGAMSLETFRALLDDLPELEAITLQGLGEPLLSPHLFEMIELATARGIRIGFNTNATLLTRARAERLIRARLDWLHVSVDGASAETFERIRDGASFARVRENVAGLTAAKRELGSENPAVTMVTVAMRGNLHEMRAVVKMAHELGIGRVHVQNLSHSFGDASGDEAYEGIRAFTLDQALWAEHDAEAERSFEAARAEADTLGVRVRLPRLVEPPPRPRRPGTPGCRWPWDAAYVTHEGKVQACCMVMGEDRAVLGDAARDGFAAVWHGEPYREFRRALLGDTPPEVCSGCSMYRGVF